MSRGEATGSSKPAGGGPGRGLEYAGMAGSLRDAGGRHRRSGSPGSGTAAHTRRRVVRRPVAEEVRRRIEAPDAPARIRRPVAALTRSVRQDYGGITHVGIAEAPHDESGDTALATADRPLSRG